MTTIIVRVLERHIKAGRRNNCYHCPIAKAISEVVEPNKVVSVNRDIVDIGDSLFNLPENAATFISDFDHGRPVAPFEFDL